MSEEQNTGTETTQDTTATTTTTDVENDIAKIEAAIANLKNLGEQLFADEIAAMKQKLSDKLAEIEEKAKEKEDQIVTEVKTWAEQFLQDHGISPGVAIIGGGLLLINLLKALGAF